MPRVVPTIGQATPGSYITAAFWNAQVQALGNFLLSPPRFSGYSVGAQTLTSSGSTFSAMLIDTEVEDTEGGHSTTTNSQRYTCQVAGLYLVSGQVCFAFNANGFRAVKLRLNGSTDVIGSETAAVPVTSGSLNTTVSTVPVYIRMAVGDYVEMMGIQNSGGNLATANSGANSTQLACLWVSQ